MLKSFIKYFIYHNIILVILFYPYTEFEEWPAPRMCILLFVTNVVVSYMKARKNKIKILRNKKIVSKSTENDEDKE